MELRELKEDSRVSESSSQALREVGNSSHNTENCEPNSRVVIEGGLEAHSKVSIATVHED